MFHLVLRYSHDCKDMELCMSALIDSWLLYSRDKRQAIALQQNRSVFDPRHPTVDTWDDGCLGVPETELDVFLAHMLTNIPLEIQSFRQYQWTKQEVCDIWDLFAQCSHKTPFNKCRVLLGCVLLCLKWHHDCCTGIPSKNFWPCIPIPLRLRLKESDLGYIELAVFFDHLQGRLFSKTRF
jgi:hypothetical protein